MSMETILSTIRLDVYNHDTSPTTIKAIALDSQTRFVQAFLEKEGEVYNPDLNATVHLIAIRPDKVGVEGVGEIVMLVPPGEDTEEPIYEEQETEEPVYEEQEVEGELVQVQTGTQTVVTQVQTGTRVISGEPAIYGVQAEITQAMIAVEGNVLLQFRLTVDDEILRTEIFRINNGKALDGETDEWADEYQGYNLDELVEKVDFIGEIIRQAVIGEISLDDAILETHAYIDHRISVHDNAIYINM